MDVEDVEMNYNLLVKEDEKGKDISKCDEMMGHYLCFDQITKNIYMVIHISINH